MARTAGMLALFTLLSRLLGLVRDMGMAWMVGCGPVADALVAALRLPHLLRRLLGEGSLSMTLTAWLVRHDVAQGQGDPLPALASGLFRRLVLVLGGLVLLGMLAAPQLLAFLAPALSPEALAEGSSLLRLCLPYVLLAGMAALGMAVLHCREVFWLPALSPVIFNVVVISAMLAGWLAGGTEAVPAALAAGMSAGGLAQWLADHIHAWVVGMSWWQAILTMMVGTHIIRLGMLSNVAAVAMLAPVVFAMAPKLGLHPVAFTMLVCDTDTFAYILPTQITVAVIAHGTDTFSSTDYARAGWVSVCIAIAYGLLVMAPWYALWGMPVWDASAPWPF